MSEARNVLGEALQLCCSAPVTGFFRTGSCETGPQDLGRHVVCAEMTEAFLAFSAERGNELREPHPAAAFPGLQPGDRWCLCASRWREALEAGVAPPVDLDATHAAALEIVSLDDLLRHALAQPGSNPVSPN